MEYLNIMGRKAKAASKILACLSTKEKNDILQKCADALIAKAGYIIAENAKDVEKAKESGMKSALVDRLSLNDKRVKDIAQGLMDLSALPDPVNEIIGMKTLPNGLVVGQKRVPFGVVGIIYESRPNVTSDAFGICFKSGNCAILRGGKDALLSNTAIVDVLKNVLGEAGLGDALQFIDDPSREIAEEFMKLREYVDVLIPRGNVSLIQSVIRNSTIPVIETGIGNCHFFVDDSADLDNAVKMIVKAKIERPGVCNACEKVLVHKNLADSFLPVICQALKDNGVEIRGDKTVTSKIDYAVEATEDDWYTEFLDYIIGIKVVDGITEAINHIQKYTSGHSEAILTESYANSQRFLNEIDAAAVYVNASTRYTDGFEFGLGAEIGISTQKLHARGPMGLKELTSTKYIIYGTGQIR